MELPRLFLGGVNGGPEPKPLASLFYATLTSNVWFMRRAEAAASALSPVGVIELLRDVPLGYVDGEAAALASSVSPKLLIR